MKRSKGVITVFLALIYGVLLAFFCTLIDVTRINSTKNQLICATDAGITSGLSCYQNNLFKDYSLMAFKNSSEVTDIVKKIMQENVQTNETTNNLFKIDLSSDNINVTAKDNLFTDVKIMERQMIYGMKYKGTENLALSVYNMIKEICNHKKDGEDSEKLKDIDENNSIKDELDKKLELMKEGQKTSVRVVAELAKNNNYKIINSIEGIYKDENMDFITDISKEKLMNKYNSKEYIKKCIENDDVYTTNTTFEKAYSYFYSKMILEMYKSYLEKEQDDNSKKDKEEDKKENKDKDKNEDKEKEKRKKEKEKKREERDKKLQKKIDNVNSWISYLDHYCKRYAYEDIEAFHKRLTSDSTLTDKINGNWFFGKSVTDTIDKGKNAAKEIVDNKSKYLDFINKYKALAEETSSHDNGVSQTSIQRYNEYIEIIEDAGNIHNELDTVIKQVETAFKEFYDYRNAMDGSSTGSNNPINQAKDKASNWNGSSRFFDNIENIISEKKGKPNLNGIANLCKDQYFINNKFIYNIVSNYKQVDTVKLLNVKKSCEEVVAVDSTFKEFYKAFKKFTDKCKKDSITAMFKDKFNSTNTVNASGLPYPSQGASEKIKSFTSLTELLPDKLKDLSDSTSFLDALGTLADDVYINEYIMTHFKQMVETENRIPEMTNLNKDKLNYAIESIIQGPDGSHIYKDESSKYTLLDDLFVIRFALNAVSFYTKQKTLGKFIELVSAAISVFFPAAEPAIKAILTLAWITLETRCDIIDIYNGHKVPLFKKEGDWCTDFEMSWQTNALSDKVSDKKSLLKNVKLRQAVEVINNNIDMYEKSDYYNKKAKSEPKLDYTDYIRLKLVLLGKDKKVMGVSNLIAANEELDNKFQDFDTSLKVDVNNSSVNIIFNTPSMKSKGGKNKFNAFSFERAYN